MGKLTILVCCALLSGCASSHKGTDRPEVWKESTSATDTISYGIAAYKGTVIDYQTSDKKTLKVDLRDPVVIGVASKPEPWGFFQFPNIYRAIDNKTIVGTWNLSPDAVDSYGKGGHGSAVSTDGGKTWKPDAAAPAGGGLLLPDGERISIYTPPALKEENTHLPDTLGFPDAATHGYKFYKMSELPSPLQGVYINRMAKGATTWTTDHAILNDPRAVRYSRKGLLPVVWWGDMHIAADGAIISGIYPGFSLDDENRISPGGVFFYRSADGGHSWYLRSRIPYQPDLKADPNGDKRLIFGFTEPAFEILADSSFLCVMRTSDGMGKSPMYYSRSVDQGLTWTRPKPFTRTGVLPKLLQLKNGVLVLASGRPGVQLRFSTDPRAEKWTAPFEMLPFENDKDAVSCGYTDLLATGPDRFLLIYSDFKFPNSQNELRKAIKVREVIVTPE